MSIPSPPPDIPVAAGRPDAADLEAAEEFGRRVGEKASLLSALDNVPSPDLPGDFPYREWNGLDAAPDCDTSLCTRCGECARICPTAAISSGVGMPTDPVACIVCCACVRGCPTGARVMRDERIREKALWLNEKCGARKEPRTWL